jgi:hypothetical protein
MTKETQSATGAVAIDVSAADQSLGRTCRGLWVGGAGDVAVTMEEGQSVTFAGIPAGSLLPVQVTAVLNSGTTATDMLALF